MHRRAHIAGTMESVAAADLVGDAIAELYAGDPDDFIQRRRDLAAEARGAGDRDAAKAIATLGKPTRSAWVVNRLVHADPDVPARLAELGGRLRSEEAALDGAVIRELSRERRELVDGLVRRALEEAGQQSPSAALRDEVTDTFNAALADPGVAEQVAAGTLQKAVHWAGFGPGIGSAVSTGPARAPAARGPAAEKAGTAAPARTGATRAGEPRAGAARADVPRSGTSRAGRAKTPAAGRATAAGRARAGQEEAAQEDAAQEDAAQEEAAREEAAARAERELAERREMVTKAEAAAADAERAADAAAATEREISDSVTFMQERLSREQQRLVQARRDTRQAAAAATRARQTLERIRRQFG